MNTTSLFLPQSIDLPVILKKLDKEATILILPEYEETTRTHLIIMVYITVLLTLIVTEIINMKNHIIVGILKIEQK